MPPSVLIRAANGSGHALSRFDPVLYLGNDFGLNPNSFTDQIWLGQIYGKNFRPRESFGQFGAKYDLGTIQKC